MATLINRNGRWTANVRVRPFKSIARTFGSKDEAEAWGNRMTAELKALRYREKDTGCFNSAEDSSDLKTAASVFQLPRLSIETSACGIYFLFKGSYCVYVGQSRQVHVRVREHRLKKLEKDFDSYAWIPCKPENLDNEELRFIKTLRPKLNVMGTELHCLFARLRCTAPGSPRYVRLAKQIEKLQAVLQKSHTNDNEAEKPLETLKKSA